MRNWLIAAIVLGAGAARAEGNGNGPPPDGWFGSFNTPAIVCDTREEIEDIVKAAQAKGGAVKAFEQLSGETGPQGDPKCVFMVVSDVAVGESVSLGRAYEADDKQVDTWAVHIGTARGDWWMLYPKKVDNPEIDL